MNLRQSVIYFGSIGIATTLLVSGVTAYRQHEAPESYVSELAPHSPEAAKPDLPALKAAAPSVGAKPATGSIVWKKSFEDAMTEARKDGKPVMVDFYTDWCVWCKKLDKDVYPKSPVVTEAANFISVKINAEKRADLASKYKVDGFPTILWLRADGSVIDRLPGYAEADQFAQMMRSAAANAGGPAV